MKSYYVYLLECSDGTLYCGYTDDLDKRVKIHNSGRGAKYTRGRIPVRTVYYEELSDKSAALKREAEIKKMSRKEKEKLIDGAITLYNVKKEGERL